MSQCRLRSFNSPQRVKGLQEAFLVCLSPNLILWLSCFLIANGLCSVSCCPRRSAEFVLIAGQIISVIHACCLLSRYR